MPRDSRRKFLKKAGLGTASLTALNWRRAIHAAGANDRIVLGVIGCGSRGSGLVRGFTGLRGAKIAYICDPDSKRRDKVKMDVKADHAVGDLRKILDDKTLDAVLIATPDHWHAPAAILACETGKHVYVEKPCSHNMREGRLLLDAARRNKVVVQHGTQCRSRGLVAEAIQLLHEGVIGEVLAAKAWNIQRRGNIGHEQPSDPPPEVDYDTWVGPAEYMPFQKNRFHYNWRWWRNFGSGDIGNDGMHELDYARWGLGVEGLPTTVAALGGKYFHDDDQQFPDTASCVFEWPGDGRVGSRRQLIFEMRLWSTNYPHNTDSGAEFYGTKGQLFVSKRGKIQVLSERNRRIEVKPKNPPKLLSHLEDFIDSIRNNRRPNADIEIGYHSASLAHLANIAVRLGRSLQLDTQKETIVGDEQANRLLARTYRKEGHWAIPQDV